MAFALILVLGLLAMSLVAWFSFMAKRKRRQGFALMATQLGFEYSPQDPFGILAEPFALFEKGDGRGVENVMWGERDGVPTRVFDYWYYDETRDTRGARSRTYHRFTCAALTIAADCPGLRIGHEGLFTKLGRALGFKDVELEYEDFNREFRVHCDDQRFAFSLLDGQMMEWLLSSRSIEAVEVVGPFVLLAARRLDAADWRVLADVAAAFHAHIPRVVWATWPRGRS